MFSLIISLEPSEHEMSGSLAKSFGTLFIFYSITAITSEVPPSSYIKGSNPLDIIWVSSNSEVKSDRIFPRAFSIGDHYVIVIDIYRYSLIGSSSIHLIPPKMRRLISSNSQSVQNYLESCHIGVKEHKIVSKLQAITSNWDDVPQ